MRTPPQSNPVWYKRVARIPDRRFLPQRRGSHETAPRRVLSRTIYASAVAPFVPGYYCYVSRTREGDLPPQHDDAGENAKGELYEVRVMDNDYNTYDQVIEICSLALGIDAVEAYRIAWEIDHLGSCAIAQASFEEAGRIAEIVRSIGIEVEIRRV